MGDLTLLSLPKINNAYIRVLSENKAIIVI